MKCKRCGSKNLVVKQEMFKDGSGPHSRCNCKDCGSFYGFLGKDQKRLFAGEILDGILEPDVDDKMKSSIKLKDLKSDLESLSFRIDLILDKLGVKNG